MAGNEDLDKPIYPYNAAGAKVEHTDSYVKGEQDDTVTMVVDGQQLTLTLSENYLGDKGAKSATLIISNASTRKNPAPPIVLYNAEVTPSDPNNRLTATTSISTPHKTVIGEPDEYAWEQKDSSGIVGKFNVLIGNVDLKKMQEDGRKVETTKMAPEIVSMLESAMFGKDSPGVMTPEEFRKIRDAFQKLDHTPEGATNAALPQPVRGKDGPVPH